MYRRPGMSHGDKLIGHRKVCFSLVAWRDPSKEDVNSKSRYFHGAEKIQDLSDLCTEERTLGYQTTVVLSLYLKF